MLPAALNLCSSVPDLAQARQSPVWSVCLRLCPKRRGGTGRKGAERARRRCPQRYQWKVHESFWSRAHVSRFQSFGLWFLPNWGFLFPWSSWCRVACGMFLLLLFSFPQREKKRSYFNARCSAADLRSLHLLHDWDDANIKMENCVSDSRCVPFAGVL